MQQIFARISALASKMGQIKKVNAHYHISDYVSFGIKIAFNIIQENRSHPLATLCFSIGAVQF